MNPVPEIRLILAALVVILGASGTYLLLPHRHGRLKPRRIHSIGAGLAGLAVLLMVPSWAPQDTFLSSVFFYAFAIGAVACGILMVTSRNPVYGALWFAAVVLSTTGLFLLAEAQFLAAGTIIVYAGAIIVTFLFVIMLAQSSGLETYDRMARSPAWATFTSFVLFWGLMYSLLVLKANPPSGPMPLAAPLAIPSQTGADVVRERAIRPTAVLPTASNQHVAGLGGTLFTDHLISVEVAGVLLFVALIGALAIATPKPPIRPGDRARTAPLVDVPVPTESTATDRARSERAIP